MERHRISTRERVCVACDHPSPGPIKLLCYRWRNHGPFFPLLERLKTDENAQHFVNGRVPVCNSCASYLQRQWNNYEKKSINLPVDKRTYRLLSDERWQKMPTKNYTEDESNMEQVHEISSYDNNNDDFDDKNPISEENTSKPPHAWQSKIPRLASQMPTPKPNSNNETEVTRSQVLTTATSSTATKLSQTQNNKLLRRMAEMKFNEEHEYIQRKVQKTMQMVHFKGRDERIREIEEELKLKIGDAEMDIEPKTEQKQQDKTTIIIPFENPQQDRKSDVDQLKTHMDREIANQRQEIENFRKAIKSEISRAMERNHNRYEKLWNFIAKVGEDQRKEVNNNRRGRPRSDDIFFSRTPKIKRKIPRHLNISNEYDESDDMGFSDYR